MSQIARAALKSFFETGDIPTEAQFIDLIDSLFNFSDDGDPVLLTGNQTAAGEKTFSNNLKVNAQANAGHNIKTFTASATFDADDGNNQAMIVTAATTIGITDELPGIYVFTLEIDSVSSPAITIGASFGDPANDNATISDVDNDINVITLVVRPGGGKYYTITTITP